MQHGACEMQGDAVRIFPRQKIGEDGTASDERVRGRAPLLVSREMVEAKFEMRQKEAAVSFGISLTAFKHVCRKLGVDRWPYRRPNRAARKVNLPVVHDSPPGREGHNWGGATRAAEIASERMQKDQH